MPNDVSIQERLKQAANALIVVDMMWDHKIPHGDDVASRIHTYISVHDDEYKVIVATKLARHAKFHPKLQALPDVQEPYAPTNVDFDSVFFGKPNEKRFNDRGEDLDTYLRRHRIGHVDFVGVHVGDLAMEAQRWGYAGSVLLQMCVGDLTPAMLFELTNGLIQIEGLMA